jgi:hypothetical protein
MDKRGTRVARKAVTLLTREFSRNIPRWDAVGMFSLSF